MHFESPTTYMFNLKSYIGGESQKDFSCLGFST